ncbi:MAG: hypothetical protein ABL876_17645, partial [Chitinophagaceae bacterium]
VYGKDVIIEAWKVDGYYPFACAEEVTIRMRTELAETSSADSGAWEYYIPTGRNGWTASLRGVLVLNDPDDDLWYALETFLLSVRGESLQIRMRFIDKNGEERYALGEVYIPEGEISGSMEDFARYVEQFQGSGPLDLSQTITPPDGENMKTKRLFWITNGAEPNEVQHNDLIGIALEDVTLVSRESDDKLEIIDSGSPTARQVRLDNNAGLLRWLNHFEANEQIVALINKEN